MWKFTKLELFFKYISEKFSLYFKAVFDNKLSIFYIRKESDNFRIAGTRKLMLTMKVHLPLVAFYRGLQVWLQLTIQLVLDKLSSFLSLSFLTSDCKSFQTARDLLLNAH